MKLYKPPRHQTIGFWLSMPFITLALSYIMYDERLWSDWRIPVTCYSIIYAIGVFSWYSHAHYDRYLRRKFPSLEQTKQRALYKLAVNLLIMTPSVLLILFLFQSFSIFDYRIQKGDLFYGFLVGLSVNIIFETLWEVVYIIDKYKELALEKELMERMQLMQEFQNLKQKVNPHFLFNCFNTLLALINEDRQRAEKFLDELSKVYRYLLRSNETGMSTLAQELSFIKSYSQLLHTRYGDGFRLQVEIDPNKHNYEVPALSLQLLVENAVKHNVISKLEPVTVVIKTEHNRLVVENNLQKKVNKQESTGIGLANIREKYRLLQHEDVIIQEGGGKFSVSLPLLSSQN